MKILTKKQEIIEHCTRLKAEGERIALVPTMGFYHAGHEALMQYATKIASKVVVSLFVNPTQFAPDEDLAAYPRDFERDAGICKSHGVDILFAPSVEEMYAEDHASMVSVPEFSRQMCGITRPTHFQGVCTIVLKLFLLCSANAAIFGQKDWQQLAIIRKMVQDLNVPIEILGHAIVRENDGLAMSSRNVYMTQEERQSAPQIYQGLCYAKQLVQQGETNVARLIQAVLLRWSEKMPLGRLDYLTIVNSNTLKTQEIIDKSSLMACAVRMGKARLIDNILL